MLVLEKITKSFDCARVLDAVDFDLRAGEVHVLFGENGAGKSTAINIVTGNLAPDSGTIVVGGASYAALTPRAARALGIAAVFQEFSLVPSLTVEENLFLGRETKRGGFLRVADMRRAAEESLARLDFKIPARARVSALSRAQQQMVEIAKVLFANARVLILDEPTASLTENDAQTLFAVVRRLKAEGVGIIYVSHRIREIRELGDRVTVLRGGRKVATVDVVDASETTLVEMMTGRSVGALFPRIVHAPAAARLTVSKLSSVDGAVRDVSLTLRAGEIVGVAGLAGCGKSAVARTLFGLIGRRSGEIVVDGRPVRQPAPRAMLRRGVCYFPADRNAEGLALNRPVLENASMAALDLPAMARRGWLRLRHEADRARATLAALGVRPLEIRTEVSHLSGGNRQKVMLARGLMRDVDVFLFDEPTVGIDVGAKAEIYAWLRQLISEGAAVLLISSELPELLNLAHRIYVMHAGAIVGHLQGDEKTEANVLRAFFGSPSALAS